ncbi:MAG: molybdopterin-dependent oxidoreductase [Pseudomonadota bacterium]
MGIKLTINGRRIEARPGQKVLEAATEHGIHIPHLCYHEQVGSIGSCRLCLVEVKPGPPKPVPACTTTVAEGMEVQTHSERVVNLRKELVRLLLMNHPLDCPVCDAAGECKLQQIVHELGITEARYRATPAHAPIDYDSPLIERHPERCINCGRCVVVCERFTGTEGIYFAGRGYDATISAGGGPLSCEFCGSCIGVCPVGALIDKTFKYRARSWELTRHETTCPYCASGCRLELNVSDNAVRRVTSDHEKTFNRGLLCGRGRFGHGFIGSADRLRTPLIRRGGNLREATWDEAIKFAAAGLEKARREHGAASVYALGSPRLTTEAGYLLQKLVRVGFGTNNVDTQARYGYLPALLALAEVFGPPRVEGGRLGGFAARCGTLTDLAAADAVLVVGADIRPELPGASLAVIAAARAEAQVCVANLRPTKLDRFATLKLRYQPGGEIGLLAAVAKALPPPGEGVFWAEGLDEFRAQLGGKSYDGLLQLTSATEADVQRLAAMLAGAARPAIVFGADLLNSGEAAEKVRALADIVLMLREEARIYPLAPKANSLGSIMAGCCPEWLPGFTPLAAGATFFEKKWGVSLSGRPQAGFPEAMSGGGPRALYCVGANPLRGWPGTLAVEEHLGRLEFFLVVQDLFLTETAARADVVLPPASFAAQAGGSFISFEGRRGILAEAAPEPGLPADWQIISRLGAALGCPLNYADAAAIRAEMAALAPLTGLNFEEIRALPRNFSGGRPAVLDLPEGGGGDGGFHLLVAGSLFHSGTLSARAAGPLSVQSEGQVLINPADAHRLGITTEVVLEAGGRKNLTAKARVSNDAPSGLLLAPDHFSGLPIHRLTSGSYLARVKVSKP